MGFCEHGNEPSVVIPVVV